MNSVGINKHIGKYSADISIDMINMILYVVQLLIDDAMFCYYYY